MNWRIFIYKDYFKSFFKLGEFTFVPTRPDLENQGKRTRFGDFFNDRSSKIFY